MTGVAVDERRLRARPGVRPARCQVDRHGNLVLVYQVDPLARHDFPLNPSTVARVLQVPFGAVQMGRGRHEGEIVITVTRHDALARPVQGWGLAGGSVRDPFVVGVTGDGNPAMLSAVGGHTLVLGTTGSRKSGLLRIVCAEAIHRPDVRVAAVDLDAGGIEFAGLGPDWLVTSKGELRELVKFVRSERTRRQGLGIAQHVASEEVPHWLLLLDEYRLCETAYPGAGADLLDIHAGARKGGFSIWNATQRATQQMISPAIKSQLLQTVVLRTKSQADLGYAADDGALPGRLPPTHNTGAFPEDSGMFLVSNRYHQWDRCRMFEVAEDEWPVSRRTDTESFDDFWFDDLVDAETAEPDERVDQLLWRAALPTADPVAQTATNVVDLAGGSTAREQILAYIARYGAESQSELVEALGLSKSRVSRVMGSLTDQGDVVTVGGVYKMRGAA